MSLIKNKRRRENLEFISGVVLWSLLVCLMISMYCSGEFDTLIHDLTKDRKLIHGILAFFLFIWASYLIYLGE